MPIEDVYSISQIAASVAVVISLIIIILQLRQASRTQRTDMHQVSLRRGFDMFQILADPAHAPVLVKAARGDAELSSEEVLRLYLLTRMVVINYQDMEWQRRAGVLKEIDVRDATSGMQLWFAAPGVRVCWSIFRRAFLDDTADLVERLFIKDMPVVAMDYASEWKRAVGELR